MIVNSFDTTFKRFIDLDNRTLRNFNTVTSEVMLNKCLATLPKDKIQGKTILDLGCCLGAMGAWAIENGAKHYTGIEIQEKYVQQANMLFCEHGFDDNVFSIIQSDVVKFLKDSESQYDIIICIGVVFAIPDILDFIKEISLKCTDYIIIDSIAPHFFYNNLPVIEVIKDQKINSASDENTPSYFSSFTGIGLLPSKEALDLLFLTNGYLTEQIFPIPVKNTDDVYNDGIQTGNKDKPILNPNRFLLKCVRKTNYLATDIVPSVYESLTSQRDDAKKTVWPTKQSDSDTVIKAGSWSFDENVAGRFRQEALNNIPDYIKVIDLSINRAKEHFPDDFCQRYVLDVGSAIGETVGAFIDAGFGNVYGVEKSFDMIKKSKHIDRIIASDTIPILGISRWDIVTLNWTLHFIQEREQFLQDLYNRMAPGGLLILTDKMDSDDLTKQQYNDFKRDRGMSDDEILAKQKAIEGVLTTKHLSWYFETLSKIGFKNINQINTRLMFRTLCAEK